MKNIHLIFQTMHIGLVALVGFIVVVVGGLYRVITNKADTYLQAQSGATLGLNIVNGISCEFSNTRRAEKDFLIPLADKYVGKHAKIVETVTADILELRAFHGGAEF